nr:MAG TPA: hypothetical protein [Caudoviricetes sp.]
MTPTAALLRLRGDFLRPNSGRGFKKCMQTNHL